MFQIPSIDPTPPLEFEECVFHKVAQPVTDTIEIALYLSVRLRRDDRNNAMRLTKSDDLIGVVAFVREQSVAVNPFNQRSSNCAIRNGTACDNSSDRHTILIHGQVKLRVEPPFVRPISWLPPTAPDASG